MTTLTTHTPTTHTPTTNRLRAPRPRLADHVSPSGLGRLWYHLYLQGSHAALGALYRAVPLPSFRVDFPPEEQKADGCAVVKLLHSLPAAAASLQLESLTPSYLFTACSGELAPSSAGLPWVDGAQVPPVYWGRRNRGEWFPE